MGAGGGPSGRNITESQIQNTLNGGEDFTIGENDTVVFSDDFEIPQGRTLTNNGTIDLADATVDIIGNFINNGTVTNNLTTINLSPNSGFKNNGIFEIDGNVNVDSKIAEFNSAGTFQAGTFKILADDNAPDTLRLNLFDEVVSSDTANIGNFSVTNFENLLEETIVEIVGLTVINIGTMESSGDISLLNSEGTINKLDVKKGITINESNILIKNELLTETSEGSTLTITSSTTSKGLLKLGEDAVATLRIKLELNGEGERISPELLIAERATFNLFNNVQNINHAGLINVSTGATLQGKKDQPLTTITGEGGGGFLKTTGLVQGINLSNVQIDVPTSDGQVIAGYLNDDGVIPTADARTIKFDLSGDPSSYTLNEKIKANPRETPEVFQILFVKDKITFNQGLGAGEQTFPQEPSMIGIPVGDGSLLLPDTTFFLNDTNPGFMNTAPAPALAAFYKQFDEFEGGVVTQKIGLSESIVE